MKWRAYHPLLDEPSDPDPRLATALDVALCRLYDVRSPRLGGRIHSNSTAPGHVVMSAPAAIERLKWEWDMSTTHRARITVLLEAQQLGGRARAHQDLAPRHVRNSPEWKHAVIWDPRSDLEAARAYELDRATVFRWRDAAGAPHNGRKGKGGEGFRIARG